MHPSLFLKPQNRVTAIANTIGNCGLGSGPWSDQLLAVAVGSVVLGHKQVVELTIWRPEHGTFKIVKSYESDWLKAIKFGFEWDASPGGSTRIVLWKDRECKVT